MLGGSVRLPWEVRVNPFVILSSGRPFNITTGRDNNGDTLFTDRPAFATDREQAGREADRVGPAGSESRARPDDRPAQPRPRARRS